MKRFAALMMFLVVAVVANAYSPPEPVYVGSGNGIGFENHTWSVDLFPEFSEWGNKYALKLQYNPGGIRIPFVTRFNIPKVICIESGVEIFDPSNSVFGEIRNQVVSFVRIGYDNRFLFPYRRWKGLELRAMIGFQHLTRTMKIDGLENGSRALDYGLHIAKYWNSKYATEGTIFIDDPVQGEYRKTKVIVEAIGRRKFYESSGLYDTGSGYRIETALHMAIEKQYGSVTVTTIDFSLQRLTRPVDISFCPRVGYQFNTGNGLESGLMVSIGLWIKKY